MKMNARTHLASDDSISAVATVSCVSSSSALMTSRAPDAVPRDTMTSPTVSQHDDRRTDETIDFNCDASNAALAAVHVSYVDLQRFCRLDHAQLHPL